MANILILGGYGYTGRSLAPHLLRQTDHCLVLAGRSLAKAEQFAAQLNAEFTGQRVSARRVDASARESLLETLPGIDWLVVASNTAQYAPIVAQAALDAGVNYLDIQLDTRKTAFLLSKAAEIEAAGRCFITEAGFHPGLPSALVRYAAARLERVTSAVTAGFLNVGPSLPYTEAVDELMELFKDYQGQVFKGGFWTRPQSYTMRKIDFGGQIGRRTCASMYFAELGGLPALIPTLRETGFYMAGSHWVNDYLITLLVMAGLKLFPKRGVRPLGKLMWWGMQHFHHPPYTVALHVEAIGEQDGKPARLTAAVSHPDGYELTAIPVVAALMQLLDGSPICRPGVWMMGHIVDPLRLFDDMQRMGAGAQVEITPVA